MPFSKVGWRPSRHAVFAEVAPALGRHSYRDTRGRFRRATPTEAGRQDIAEARALTSARGAQFGVFRGRLSDRAFAIRRGREVPLDRAMIEAVLNSASRRGIQLLYNRLVATSPVDTGLLRSQWRTSRRGVTNSVPYVQQTEFVNRSSRGYIRRAIRWTLAHQRVRSRQGMLVMNGQTVVRV